MTRARNRVTSLVAAFGCVLVAGVSAGLPRESSLASEKDEAGKARPAADEQAEGRRAAERAISGIELEIQMGDTWSKVKRIEQPLLLYGDPTRNNDRGSLWGWGEKGRPVALLELYQNLTDRTKWVFAVCNTSGARLRATRAGAPWWEENDSATEPKDIPHAPVPAAQAAPRSRQLKQLAQKFTGHQFWDPNNSRYELRRIERPLHSYRDEAGGLLEGGLFALANGTNPEILLFVEARVDPKDKSRAVWQYAAGRLAHAELHLDYDGKEIFSAPRAGALSGRDKPYWVDFIPAAPDAGPGK